MRIATESTENPTAMLMLLDLSFYKRYLPVQAKGSFVLEM